MTLTGAQLQQIRETLLAAFDDASLRQVVRIGLDKQLEHIAGGNNLTDRVFELVEWVSRHDGVAELVAAAYNHNSTSQDVQQLAAAVMGWPNCAYSGLTIFSGQAYTFAPRAMELVYLERLVTSYEVWRDKYTPLAGVAIVKAESDSPLQLPDMFVPTGFEKLVEYGYGRDRRVERIPVDDLREAVARYNRLAVLGEPGSGKTTTLWRLVYDYALAARGDPNAPIPVLVPLGGYSGQESALEYATQQAGCLASFLPAYLARGRAVLMLDALNEMPRDGYKDRVGRVHGLLGSFPRAAVVVTCRALDYMDVLGLERLEIRPLNAKQQREFLRRYLGQVDGERLYKLLAGDVTNVDLVRDPPPLVKMAANPYLLLMFARVYNPETASLPRNRGKLFASFVDTLLYRESKSQWSSSWPGRDVLFDALSELAFNIQWRDTNGASVDEDWALECIKSSTELVDDVLFFSLHAAILERANKSIRFTHQLIQEYLAAEGWLARMEAGDDLREPWHHALMRAGWWEETVVLAAGLMDDASVFLERLVSVNPIVAARCIGTSGAQIPPKHVVSSLQGKLIKITTRKDEYIGTRVLAGDALNWLNDPRPGVGLVGDIPDIQWCKVPAGEFLYGAVDELNISCHLEYGYWLHRPIPETKDVRTFLIGAYPITNRQFDAFIVNGGYSEQWRSCWTKAGWSWKINNEIHGPVRYGGDFDLANHPVVGVSYYEALAFCRWFRSKAGYTIWLPTEEQWEKAVRGLNGLLFPWGNEPESDAANSRPEELHCTSAVGIFPIDRSDFGVLDGMGNVTEWTQSMYGSDILDDRIPLLEGTSLRAVRGSAFCDNLRPCFEHDGSVPWHRSEFCGFRVIRYP